MQKSPIETDGVPHGSDFDRFRAAVAASFVPLKVTSDAPGRFSGDVRSRELDRVHLARIQAAEHAVERTPELAERGGDGLFKVSIQRQGWGLLVQDNREALLGPGDLAVYDTGRPYSLAFDRDVEVGVLMFPHSALDLPPEAVRQLTAVRFSGSEGLAAVVSPFIASLGRRIDDLADASGPRVANTAVDLLSTMFAATLDVTRERADPHHALRREVRAYIERHLGDPDLGPGSVAAAHFISTRHLHALFREEDASVAAWIRARRLERCRKDLADPLQADRTIGEIGRRWGLGDAAHLSHAFTAAFGESPSDVRARATR